MSLRNLDLQQRSVHLLLPTSHSAVHFKLVYIVVIFLHFRLTSYIRCVLTRLVITDDCGSVDNGRCKFLDPSGTFTKISSCTVVPQKNSVLIYKRRQYSLIPTIIASYLHKHYRAKLSKSDIERCVRLFSTKPILPPDKVCRIQASPSTLLISDLPIYYDGYYFCLSIEWRHE